MSEVDSIVQFIQYFLTTPSGLLALVLGPAGVAVLSQIFKKLARIESERWAIVTVFVIAGLEAGLAWLTSAENLPPSIIGISTPFIVGLAQPFYFYGIKPLSKVYAGYKANEESISKKVAEIEAVEVVNKQPELTPVTVVKPETILDSPDVPAQYLLDQEAKNEAEKRPFVDF